MASNGRERSFVVVQLSGGNDYVNTLVPYNNGMYYDSRPSVSIEPQNVLRIDGEVGFRPGMESMKRLWDEGSVAIVNGIGYPSPDRVPLPFDGHLAHRSPGRYRHRRLAGQSYSRDGPQRRERADRRELRARSTPCAGCRGVPVASVGNLETYGLFTDMEDERLRKFALDTFGKMYGGAQGKGAVMDFLGQTGRDALKGADILKTAPAKYTSGVEYAANPIAQSLKGVAQVMFADLGTRVFYTQHGSFDTHSGELDTHAKLWEEVSGAVGDFMDDLREHGRQDDAVILIFSEFGRRIKDNGSGTDHGSGGVAFVVGDPVKGGMYGEYPSLAEEDQLMGDLQFNNDFRQTYTTVLERWLGLDAAPIVNGRFEQFDLVAHGGLAG